MGRTKQASTSGTDPRSEAVKIPEYQAKSESRTRRIPGIEIFHKYKHVA